MTQRRRARDRSQPPWLIRFGYVAVAVLTILVTLLGWGLHERIPLLQNLNGQLLDAQLRARGPLAPLQTDDRPAIVLLLIDERSIQAIGSLPIDRRILARVVDQLNADGARVILFDLLFPEPSPHGLAADRAFATAIAQAGNVLLAYALPDDTPVATTLANGPVLDSAYLRYRNDARGADIELAPTRVLAPIPTLGAAAHGLGHVSVLTTADGALRYDLPALAFDGEWLPSLAVAAAARLSGTPWNAVEARLADRIAIGAIQVPIDARSRQWVNYYGPAGTFPTYSLADYAAGRFDPADFKGRVVFIGGTALGTNDRNLSPFDPGLPSVERVATVLDNLISERWLERPDWGAPAVLLLILLLPPLAVWLVARLPPMRAIMALVLIGLVIVGLSQGLLVQQRQILPMVFPLFALTLAGGSGLTWRARLDSHARQQAEQALRASEQRYALAASGANDGLWDWDIAEDALYLSPRARDLLGLEVEADSEPDLESVNAAQGIGSLFAPLGQVERANCEQELDAHLAGQTGQFNRIVALDRAYEPRWLLIRGVAVREGDRPVRMAGSLTDLTEQKRLERQIAFDALHDRLTGLANRDLFTDRIDQWLRLSREEATPGIGLVLLDIDGFRAINEAHGQLGGNAVLIQLASRLSVLKTEGILVSRLGADQFALAFRGPDELSVAQRAQILLAAPFKLDADLKPIPVSISQAHTAQGLGSTDELLAAATLALIQAGQSASGGSAPIDRMPWFCYNHVNLR